MTSKEALNKIKHIDLHGQYPYPYYLKDDLEYKEVLEILDIALEQAQKQEKLLEQIKDIINRPYDSYNISVLERSGRYVQIIELIKELENE